MRGEGQRNDWRQGHRHPISCKHVFGGGEEKGAVKADDCTMRTADDVRQCDFSCTFFVSVSVLVSVLKNERTHLLKVYYFGDN